MSFTYRENYWDKPALKRMFIDHLIAIHNLDLTLWGELGYWDENYRPFSYFDGDRCASNVCVYSMDMMIQGKQRSVAQISAVGTLPEYRNQGLNSELTLRAIDWAKDRHDFFFLFADTDARPYYRKRGFRQIEEHHARIAVSGRTPLPGLVKLDVNVKQDRALIFRIASQRSPVSDVLGILNEKLFMFWCLYFHRDHIYYVADLDSIVLFKSEAGVVSVYDIASANVPEFYALYPYFCRESDQAVEFFFMEDRLNLRNATRVASADNGAHVSGAFPFEGRKVIFPFTAHA